MCLLNWGSEQKPYMPVSFVPHCLCCVCSSEFQLYIGRKRVVLDKLSHGLAQKHLPSNMPVLSGYLRKAQVYMWVVISIDLGICTYIYTLTGYCYRQNWLELCLELRIYLLITLQLLPQKHHMSVLLSTAFGRRRFDFPTVLVFPVKLCISIKICAYTLIHIYIDR